MFAAAAAAAATTPAAPPPPSAPATTTTNRESAATPVAQPPPVPHPSPPTLPRPLPPSSSFSSSSSLVLHPSSFTRPSLFLPPRSSRNPFLSKESKSGPPPSRAALNPVFPHAALNALHSSQREADARRSPGSSVGGFCLVRREPSAPGAVPGFRLLLRACGRTLHPRLVRTTARTRILSCTCTTVLSSPLY